MSESADKPHEPTPRKLEKAREKGEVARSAELNTFAMYLGIVLSLYFITSEIATRLVKIGSSYLRHADQLDILNAGSIAIREVVLLSTFIVTLPVITTLLSIAIQRSAVFAPTRLAPKLSRISPISGAINKFGPNGLFEFAKSATKMLVYVSILAAFLWVSAEQIITSAALPAERSFRLLAHLGLIALEIILGVALAIAIIDYSWQRYSHLAKNRMSQQELKDEIKDSDGDPALKARRRQRAEEIATNQMLLDVPNATVVVVNPTHFAVALRWSPTDPTPPVCLAKGVDLVAARIREAANNGKVPIYSDPATARALYATVDIGAPIPREQFQAVAAAIRFAESLRQGRSSS